MNGEMDYYEIYRECPRWWRGIWTGTDISWQSLDRTRSIAWSACTTRSATITWI